ncbi:LamG-like jellyroll fold domain-containing protein [Aquirufa sp. A-Brett2-15D]
MKSFIAFLFLLITTLSSAQMGLPIQTSLLPKNNLVVNYDFSKSAGFTRGATTATNLAGTASGNSTLYNSPVFMNSLGFISFNGSNQYLATPNIRTYFKSVNTSTQRSFTMSFWFYPLTTTGVLVSELDSHVPSGGWHASNIEILNGFIKYRIWNGPIITSSSAVSINQWHHIALVYDGTSVKGYLNGVLQGTQAGARDIPPSSQNYAIGAGETTNMGASAYGNFNLAQFKIHNLPLTDKEILSEYETRKEEFDYTIHSPSTNSNPTYWGISSAWNSETTFTQLHYTPWLNNATLGWAASANDANQWITLNYDVPAYIKGVAIQGRANNGGQWVTKAHIESSLTGSAPWTRVLTNADVNTNSLDDVRINFPTSVFAKTIRVVPVAWNNHITLRMGLLVKPNVYTSDNLVLHYDPSTTESYAGTGTSISDLTGNGLTGTMSNITYSNSAFTFNGINSQVSIPDNALIEPGTGSWTIEVWLNNSGSSGTVLGKYNNGGNGANISYALRLVGANAIRADFSNGSTAQVTDNYTFAANNWVQMVYVWDKTNNNIYTYSNGVLKQTKAIAISGGILNATTNLFLGSYNGGEYSQYFTGEMGIVRLYKKALSATEVFKNYDANKAIYGIIQNGLVMNLTSPPSSGITWTDISGSGNNATLVGSPTYTASNGGGYTTSTGSYISTGYNLPNTFTVSVASSFNPTTYWATIWANEIWNTGKGYLSYFNSATGIDIGSPSGQSTIPMNDYNTVHIWDFVVSGSTYVLYKDGVSVGTGTFTAPSGGLSTNGLYFGARHTNGGTGATDYGPGTFYSMRVYNRALNVDEVKINFSFLRSSYGL